MKHLKFPSPPEETGGSNPSGSLNMSSGRMCFRTLSRRLGFLTNENLDLIVGTHGFRPLSRRLGVLTEKSITKGYQLYVSVPYRGEWGVLRNSDTYKIFLKTMFPSPLEVIGGSYMQKTTQVALLHHVSVPFRGNWGFLLTDSAMLFGFLLSFRPLPR